MAVGPIQFSVSTNPIDGLNARLKALGRKEVITSIKSYPSCGACTDHDAYYIDGNGEECSYKYRQYPTDSPDRFAERFIIHLSAAEQVAKEREDRKRDSPLTFKVNSAVRADMEYQQYLDDHKAMTLGSLFGENRFPRARERAFLDFRTQAASQTRYESFDYSDPHSGAVKRVLDACLTHHLPDLSSIKCDLFVAVEHDHAVVQMSTPMPDWRKCRTIRIPLSQDMPWYTAAQQARDTLREWIDDAAQKKSDTAMAGNDCTVWIWGIEYPNARVEYREGIEQVPSLSIGIGKFGTSNGIYKAGAKVSSIPRTVDKNGPFDITLKYAKGGVTVLKGCTWIADGEISCDSIVKDSIAAYDSAIRHVVDWGSYPSNMRVAAAQKIPAGAMVNSDGEVVGKATPARAMAYMNGVPVGALTSIDYSGTVRLDTDAEGRVTTTVQQVREAIDRSTAISVPTEDEIKQMFLDRMAQEGYKSPTAHPTLNSLASVVAASTHETYKAMERLGQDMRAGFEQSRMRFDNLASQPLTQENLKKAFAELTKPMPTLPNYTDFLPNSKVTGVTNDKDGNSIVSLETTLPWPPASVNVPLDFAPQIGDNNSMSEPNAGAVDNSTKLPAISIEILNEHFRLSGIQVVVKSIKAHPRIHGGYDHRAYYIGRNGEEYSFDWFQGPSELPEEFGRKFIECLIARGEMVQRNSPLDSAAKIGDNEGMSEPNAEHVREWQQYVHDHKELRAGKLLEISNCPHPRAREWAYAHSDREHPNTAEQYESSNFCEVDWYAGKSLIKNYLRLRGITARVETDKTRWSDEKLAAARISVRGITLDHFIPKQENTWIRLAWEVFTRIAPALGMSLDKSAEIGDDTSENERGMSVSDHNEAINSLVRWSGTINNAYVVTRVADGCSFFKIDYTLGFNEHHDLQVSVDVKDGSMIYSALASELVKRGHASDRNIATKETTVSDTNTPIASFKNRATTEAIEVAYRTAAIKLPDLVRKQLVKRMAAKGGKRPSQARLSLAEEMLSGDEGSLIVAGILSLALSASPEFIKSKMPWLDLNRLATELRLNVETRIACAVADMLGMYLDGALEALKEAFGGSQQLLLAESSKPDESALFNGVPKAETVRV